MTRTNYVVRAAVAACFATAAGQALAVVNISNNTGVPRVANTVPTATTTLDAAATFKLDIQVQPPVGISPKAANPVYLKLNLLNGAKFASPPQLRCSAFSGGISADTTAVTAGVQAGGNGFSNVTFVMSATDNNATSGSFMSSAFCSATVTAITISGLNNVGVSATFEYTDGLITTSSNIAGNLVTFVNAFSATYSASTATTAVVDATSGSDNFVNAQNNTQGTALLGFLRFDRNADSASTASNMGTDHLLGEALNAGSGSITISGPAIEAMKAAKSSAGLYLTSAATNDCATSIKGAFQATAANSVTFTGLSTANISGGVFVCGVVLSGTTQILTGQIQGQFAGGPVSGVSITFPAAGNMANIQQNGKSKNAYFVNASTSPSKTSVIRILNNGGVTGTIRASAYLVGDGVTGTTPNVAGTAVGTANATIGTLATGESLSLTSAQLEALLGYTPATPQTKYRVVFSGGLTDFKVLNYTRDVVGGYITTSQYQDD